MRILFFMVAGGLAVGIVYSAIKLWEDAAGRHRLGFLWLLAALGGLVVLAALLGLDMH